jgi:hypothetical protein
MPRVRIHFSKTGYACFIPHVDLPMLFWRSARRAGLVPEMTQGFSPHPRLALCPPLPVGVVGDREPADFWFAGWDETSLMRWGKSLPTGIEITDAHEITSRDALSLNKLCTAASYSFEPTRGADPAMIAEVLESALRGTGTFLGASVSSGVAMVTASDLERCGASFMVKRLAESGVISGWSELAITRTAVGRWSEDAGKVIPLTEE